MSNAEAPASFEELRQRYRRELFDEQIPFWNRLGVDHEHGGFCCSLDYDGRRVNDEKFTWFQGRGLWVYSYLYNHLKPSPEYLEIAERTKAFLLAHAPQPDGTWASKVSREGELLVPEADFYGRYFAIEGLWEYCHAAGDEQAHEAALGMFKELFRRETGPDASDPITQGFWMVNINIARQILERESDPEISEIADRAIDAIIDKHYNPEIGLNNEHLNRDFSRPPKEAMKCNFGHSIETLWMVMAEARRRGDDRLWVTCTERIQRHLNVGWDWIYGGLSMWVNVDHGAYEWPVESVPGTDLEFRAVGEYNYTKTLWALDEILIATLLIHERTGASWAREFFDRTQRLIDEKFFMKAKAGQPTYVLFADRKVTPPASSTRQDNYHRLRALMFSLMTLERLTG